MTKQLELITPRQQALLDYIQYTLEGYTTRAATKKAGRTYGYFYSFGLSRKFILDHKHLPPLEIITRAKQWKELTEHPKHTISHKEFWGEALKPTPVPMAYWVVLSAALAFAFAMTHM